MAGVIRERDGAVGILTMDEAASLNAMTPDLLGGLATRFPKTTLEWNSAKLKFRNEKQANVFLKRPYRAGWSVKGLA